MASLMHQADRFYCQFLYHGKRHCFSPGKVTKEEAETKAAQVDYLLMRIKQGLIQLPGDTDIITFIRYDGKTQVAGTGSATKDTLTLGRLRDDRFKHLVGTVGERFPVEELSLIRHALMPDSVFARIDAKLTAAQAGYSVLRHELAFTCTWSA